MLHNYYYNYIYNINIFYKLLIIIIINNSQKHLMYMCVSWQSSRAKILPPCHSNTSVLFLLPTETYAGWWVPYNTTTWAVVFWAPRRRPEGVSRVKWVLIEVVKGNESMTPGGWEVKVAGGQTRNWEGAPSCGSEGQFKDKGLQAKGAACNGFCVQSLKIWISCFSFNALERLELYNCYWSSCRINGIRMGDGWAYVKNNFCVCAHFYLHVFIYFIFSCRVMSWSFES